LVSRLCGVCQVKASTLSIQVSVTPARNHSRRSRRARNSRSTSKFEATENWKIQTLPLARIKKIMKSEEIILQELNKERQQKAVEEAGTDGSDVLKPFTKFMISGEAPVLMSKACELLIKDLSFRAWRHTERNRRRTLQRQDLHAAVGESEVYDFLIDIVPRVTAPKSSVSNPVDAAAAAAAAMPPLPPGIPMPGIPTQLPTTVAPPMNTQGQQIPGIDHSMIQQMQGHPGQQQPGVMNHDPNQQAHYAYMNMPSAPSADLGQNANQGSQQQVQQWLTQAETVSTLQTS